jgi:hypothetical protein
MKRSIDKQREACPSKADHADEPDGYLEWHAWAEKMGKTHDQAQCPGCGLWVIWMPKATA